MKGTTSLLPDVDPPRSKLLSQKELDYYVEQYKRRGFEGGLNYYKTRQLNWELEVEANLPKVIQHQALMLTAGKDFILTPKLAAGMKHTVKNLRMAVIFPSSHIFTRSPFSSFDEFPQHIEDAAHWILVEKYAEVNKILIDWLASLDLTGPLSKL